ncbi:hypothetical protein, partial [Pseudomonas sp. Sample_22]|uniref:hypothetical protein n=1 Tax=Pseudomonas sp. Sample_22 TaxID=2448266 RepID=UPI0015B02EB1
VNQDQKIAGNDIKLGIPTKIPTKSSSGAKTMPQTPTQPQGSQAVPRVDEELFTSVVPTGPLTLPKTGTSTSAPLIKGPEVKLPEPTQRPGPSISAPTSEEIAGLPPKTITVKPKAPVLTPEDDLDIPRPGASINAPTREEIAGLPPKTITVKPKTPVLIPEDDLDIPPISKPAWTVAARNEYKRPTSRISAEPRGGVFTVNKGATAPTAQPGALARFDTEAPTKGLQVMKPGSANDRSGKMIYDSRQASAPVSRDDQAIINGSASPKESLTHAVGNEPALAKTPVDVEDVTIDFDRKSASAQTPKHIPALSEDAQ